MFQLLTTMKLFLRNVLFFNPLSVTFSRIAYVLIVKKLYERAPDLNCSDSTLLYPKKEHKEETLGLEIIEITNSTQLLWEI